MLTWPDRKSSRKDKDFPGRQKEKALNSVKAHLLLNPGDFL